MQCIITTVQARGVHPVILEVPEYGIDDVPAGKFPYGFLVDAKHLLYRAVCDGMERDVISGYREALMLSLPPAVREDMTVVSFSPLVDDYSKHRDLYANPTHLNQEGYQRLGRMIGDNIVRAHSKRLQRRAESPY